jgi:transposase
VEYFAGLDISMKETHICVVDRDGEVVLEVKVPTSPTAIAARPLSLLIARKSCRELYRIAALQCFGRTVDHPIL